VRSLTAEEKEDIRDRLGSTPADVPEMMHRISKILRELSHLTVVVQAPRLESDVLEHIEFVRLRENQMLAVIATESGHIQNKVVPVDFPLAAGELERLNNYLNSLVKGLTLDQVRARVAAEIETERAAHDQVMGKALRLAASAVTPDAGRPDANVLVDGQSNLLASMDDLDRAKAVLRALEEKDTILKLLDRTLSAPGICVFIGAEANLADLTDVSVVTATYGVDVRPLGTIGVIGPSRMNYSKVIPLVDFTAEVLTEALPKRG
jgi:heat-inducible transcriptional repressor